MKTLTAFDAVLSVLSAAIDRPRLALSTAERRPSLNIQGGRWQRVSEIFEEVLELRR